MRSLAKPVLALIAAAALSSGVCACGQAPAPSGASPSTSPSTSTPATAQPTSTAPSVDEMYAKAMAAVEDANSVSLKMTNKGVDDSYTGVVSGTLDGTTEKHVYRDSDGASWTRLLIDGAVYIKANQAFWRSLDLPGLDPARPADRWVKLTGDVPEALRTPDLKRLLLAWLSDWAPGAIRHEAADVTVQGVNGTRSYRAMLSSEDNEFVVNAQTWLPSRFTALDPDTGANTVTLTGWNSVERIPAPSVYATLELHAG